MASAVTLINVLAKKYSEDCRIKGSVAVPLEDLKGFVQKMPRDTRLVVYCAKYGCPLSGEAWKLLKSLGFTNIAAYEGGMQEWLQKGYPTEGPCELPYLTESIEKPAGVSKDGVVHISAEELKRLLEA